MFNNKPVLIIYGPTAVGKTDFVYELSEHINLEIINMDMGQFYVPFSIGTAKPNWHNHTVVHHLFDILDEPHNFSVSAYRSRLAKTLQEVHARNNTPVLVGGSGFYLKSLFFPPLPVLGQDEKPNTTALDENSQNLWQLLYGIDPQRASEIHHNDTYRIKRALELWNSTQTLPSQNKPIFSPLFTNSLIVCLARTKDELYTRINKRVVDMIHNGWIEEVDALRGTPWESFMKDKKLIGYDVLCAHRENQSLHNFDMTVQIIQQKTRHYAKRQLTFWRMFERMINTASQKDSNIILDYINLTQAANDFSIQQLKKKIISIFL